MTNSFLLRTLELRLGTKLKAQNTENTLFERCSKVKTVKQIAVAGTLDTLPLLQPSAATILNVEVSFIFFRENKLLNLYLLQ